MMTPSCERLKRRKRRKHGKISECSSFTTGKSRGSSWKMTRKEKVGQLNQRLYGFRIYERDGEKITFTDEFYEEVEKMGGLGVYMVSTGRTPGRTRMRRPESHRHLRKKPTIPFRNMCWSIPACTFR